MSKAITIKEISSWVGTLNSKQVLGYLPKKLLLTNLDVKKHKNCLMSDIVLTFQILSKSDLRVFVPNRNWITKWFKPRIVKQIPIYHSVEWDLPFGFADAAIHLCKQEITARFYNIMIID